MLLFHMVVNKRPYLQNTLIVSTSGFHQYFCYDQAFTVIYRDHVIDKMADIYKKAFPKRSKNKLIALLRVSYSILLLFKCVIDFQIGKLG